MSAVFAIGVVLALESMLSIRQFGFNFWRTSTWDPVSGDFGALPFIWGTLYSSILALLISTPIALGIAVFLTETSPTLKIAEDLTRTPAPQHKDIVFDVQGVGVSYDGNLAVAELLSV